ncbi:hypothetical protein [Streptosporangium roseum]|uniref:hypothetical protein n=1 Tax=Streptosporangium roseum TaxID=2001 RepID=UPI0004CD6C2E|nr:hypothetical protein [Streptosporangium roseum]
MHDELAAVLVLAGSTADVGRLNLAARAIRRASGELSGPDRLYRLPGGRTLALAVGDHVRIRTNDYRSHKSRGKNADVLNGYPGTVVAIHGDRSVIVQWRRPGANGPALVVEKVSAAYIAVGGLSHGTAMTVAAAQGLTADRTLVYGMGLDPHTLYAAMTRDRLSAHLYLPRTVLESDADRAATAHPATPPRNCTAPWTPTPPPCKATAPTASSAPNPNRSPRCAPASGRPPSRPRSRRWPRPSSRP